MRRVVMFSGGIGSWAAAKRVAERHAPAKVINFIEERDKATIDRLHELVERQCRTGSSKTLDLLERYLLKEYARVSETQGAR